MNTMHVSLSKKKDFKACENVTRQTLFQGPVGFPGDPGPPGEVGPRVSTDLSFTLRLTFAAIVLKY